MTAGTTEPIQPVEIERPRVDIREKVTGAARYLEDLPHPPGIAYAAAIRSPYSHATIVSVDSSGAAVHPRGPRGADRTPSPSTTCTSSPIHPTTASSRRTALASTGT